MFVMTAIVAALLALGLAGLWHFLLQLLLSAIFAAAVFFFARRAVRKPSPPHVIVMLLVLLVLAVVGVMSSLWVARETLTQALMHFGAAAGAIGGYLAAVSSSRFPEKRLHAAWRYLYAAAVTSLLLAWGTLHGLEKSYDAQTERHARHIQERGISWSWSKSTSRAVGPLQLFNLWTLDVHDWGRRATDADLETVAAVDVVNSLNLAGSQITDAGLAHLKSLHNLKSLDVRGTKVTTQALDDLRQALPNLTDVKQ